MVITRRATAGRRDSTDNKKVKDDRPHRTKTRWDKDQLVGGSRTPAEQDHAKLCGESLAPATITPRFGKDSRRRQTTGPRPAAAVRVWVGSPGAVPPYQRVINFCSTQSSSLRDDHCRECVALKRRNAFVPKEEQRCFQSAIGGDAHGDGACGQLRIDAAAGLAAITRQCVNVSQP